MTATLPASALDPNCPLKELRVFEERSDASAARGSKPQQPAGAKQAIVWSAVLQKNDEFYIMQLLVGKSSKGVPAGKANATVPAAEYQLWERWGRSEETSRIQSYGSKLSDAKEKFEAHFLKLTGKPWAELAAQRAASNPSSPNASSAPSVSLKPGKWVLGGITQDMVFRRETSLGSTHESLEEEEEDPEEEEEAFEDDDEFVTTTHTKSKKPEKVLRDPFADDEPTQPAGRKRGREDDEASDGDLDGGDSDSTNSSVVDNDQDYINLCALRVEKKPTSAEAWFNLGIAMVDGSAVATMINGKITSLLEVHVKAVELAPTDGDAWCNLGATMKPGDSVDINGKTYDYIGVRLHSTELLPNAADCWSNLAFALSPGQVVSVSGQSYSRIQAAVKAVELDAEESGNFDTLGVALAAEEGPTPTASVKLRGEEKVYNAESAFIRAILLDKEAPWPWFHLGKLLYDEKGVSSPDKISVQFQGKSYSATDCFKRAVGVEEAADEFGAELRQIEPESAKLLVSLGLLREPTEEERQEHERLLQGIRPALDVPVPVQEHPSSSVTIAKKGK